LRHGTVHYRTTTRRNVEASVNREVASYRSQTSTLIHTAPYLQTQVRKEATAHLLVFPTTTQSPKTASSSHNKMSIASDNLKFEMADCGICNMIMCQRIPPLRMHTSMWRNVDTEAR
jgi:hypothetical protein